MKFISLNILLIFLVSLDVFSQKLSVDFVGLTGNKSNDLEAELFYLPEVNSKNTKGVFYSEGYSYQLLLNIYFRTGKMPKDGTKNVLYKIDGTNKKYYSRLYKEIQANPDNFTKIYAIDYEQNFKAACAASLFLIPVDFSSGIKYPYPEKIREVIESNKYNEIYFNGFPSFLNDTANFKNYVNNIRNHLIEDEKVFQNYYKDNFENFKMLVENLYQSIEYVELKKRDPQAAEIKGTNYMYSNIKKILEGNSNLTNNVVFLNSHDYIKNSTYSISLIDLFVKNVPSVSVSSVQFIDKPILKDFYDIKVAF